MAVAVTVGGENYFINYGVASKESGQIVTNETIFEIGSVSKTFTATLASYAEESGALSLSDRASQYLPSLRGSSFDNISLLDLGTYTAGGLPLQFPNYVDSHQKMIDYFYNWKPTYSAGTHRLYSNPSIGLFGYLAARSMGKSYEDLLESKLFTEMGLRSSHISIPQEQMSNYAYGYDKEGKPIRVSAGTLDAEGYGVKSSSGDIIRFVEANMQPTDLQEPLKRAIIATHKGYYQVGDMTQGLGWEIYPYPIGLDRLLAGNSKKMLFEANEAIKLSPPTPPQNNVLINKTGSTSGFGAYVAFIPKKRMGIVILANKNYPIPERVKIAYEVLSALDTQVDLQESGGEGEFKQI